MAKAGEALRKGEPGDLLTVDPEVATCHRFEALEANATYPSSSGDRGAGGVQVSGSELLNRAVDKSSTYVSQSSGDPGPRCNPSGYGRLHRSAGYSN